MASTAGLSAQGRMLVGTVIVLGCVVVSASVYQLALAPPDTQWLILVALTLVSGSATVKLPSVPASISISETFVFSAVLLYGPAAGTVIVALDGLVISFWISKRVRSFHRTLFNMSAPALSAWASAQLFFWLSKVEPLSVREANVSAFLPALFLFAVAYFGLNSGLIALAVASEKKLRSIDVWRDNLMWLSLNYFCGASVAVLLVTYTRRVDLQYVGVIVPLLLVLYFTFKTSMARVEDADRHVNNINRLYLSTIETLAMAIDAKDQVTHGHIRRVQRYAVDLAKRVGVGDENLLRAIEAAALLHDMGKLAVPEHILNKPGSLTPAEFDKMKLHATVGADILSAVQFPYPVVPIVRHHHESWDGTGYPTGLRGTDIPIGARILAVVDCFDALTSDRPYRPRLSHEHAVDILQGRRGSMYDPFVVDTFFELLQDNGNRDRTHSLPSPSGSRLSGPPASAPHVRDPAPQVVLAFELATVLAKCGDADAIGQALTHYMPPVVPYDLGVVYRFNPITETISAVQTIGSVSCFNEALPEIPVGERLSGWVAANRVTIANSDASLDLNDTSFEGMSTCISAPIQFADNLLGVLTLYTKSSTRYSPHHCSLLEAVCVQLGPLMSDRAFRPPHSSDNRLCCEPVASDV